MGAWLLCAGYSSTIQPSTRNSPVWPPVLTWTPGPSASAACRPTPVPAGGGLPPRCPSSLSPARGGSPPGCKPSPAPAGGGAPQSATGGATSPAVASYTRTLLSGRKNTVALILSQVATISSSPWSTSLNMAEVAPATNWCDICQRKTVAPLKSLSTFVLLTLTVNSTRLITPTLSIQGFKPDVCGIGKWELLHLLLTPLNKTVRKHV